MQHLSYARQRKLQNWYRNSAPPHSTAPTKAGEKAKTSWLTIGAGIVSTTTVILILLGYGVAWSVESTFGIHHSSVFQSPMELIDLSSIALLGFSSLMEKGFSEAGSLLLYLYQSFGWILGVVAGLYLTVAAIGWFYEPQKKGLKKTTNHSERLHWGLTAKRYLWTNTIIGLIILVYPIFSIASIAAMGVFVILLASVPIIGMGAGKMYISERVIGPEVCLSYARLDDRRHPQKPSPSSKEEVVKGVHCIALTKDGKTLASGRVVVYTSSAIVLVDTQGKAQRFSTSDVTVASINSLPPQNLDGKRN